MTCSICGGLVRVNPGRPDGYVHQDVHEMDPSVYEHSSARQLGAGPLVGKRRSALDLYLDQPEVIGFARSYDLLVPVDGGQEPIVLGNH